MRWNLAPGPRAAEPFPAAGDLPRIGFALVLCAAARLLPVPRVTALERRRPALDTLTVVVSGAMVLWYLILGPYVAARGAGAGIVAAAVAYPLLDLVMIFGFARVLVRGAGAGTRPPLVLLTIGSFFLFAGDAWAGYLQARQGDLRAGGLPLAGVLTMQFCFALAAVSQARNPHGSVSGQGRYLVGGNLPYAAIGVAYG